MILSSFSLRSNLYPEVYSSENVEVATEIFTKKITKILDVMAPVKSVQVKTRYAPWLSATLKEAMKEKTKPSKYLQKLDLEKTGRDSES